MEEIPENTVNETHDGSLPTQLAMSLGEKVRLKILEMRNKANLQAETSQHQQPPINVIKINNIPTSTPTQEASPPNIATTSRQLTPANPLNNTQGSGVSVIHRDKIWRDIETLAASGGFKSSYCKFWGKSRYDTMAKKAGKLFRDYKSTKKRALHLNRSNRKIAGKLAKFCEENPSDEKLLLKLYQVTKNNSFEATGSFKRRLCFIINKIEEMNNSDYKAPTIK